MLSIGHHKIIVKALDILRKDQIDVYNFYNDCSENSKNKIIEGAILPDFDEHYSGSHYYIYQEGSDYFKNRLGKYMRSARTSFMEHYTMAINQYMNGKKDIAFSSLGRAVHYMTDMGTPPHTTNVSDANVGSSLLLRPHIKYEIYAKDNIEKYYINASSKYEYVANTSFDKILNNLVIQTSRFRKDLLKRRNYDEIMSVSIPLILEMVTGLLYRFYVEINSKPFYFEDNQNYIFGKISLLEDGTYQIDGKKGQWRFINDNGKYLITSSLYKYKKVLNTKMKIVKFKPDKPNVYWVIEN